MPTEYIPKSLALDIIARLCTDYSAAYAEISAARGLEITTCHECRWGQTDDIGTMHCHKYHIHKRAYGFCDDGESGEFFWGGANGAEERNNLEVVPIESARLMGYEVVEEKTDIPLVCRHLGIEPGKPFNVRGYPNREYPPLVYSDGQIRFYSPESGKATKVGGRAVCWMIDHPDKVEPCMYYEEETHDEDMKGAFNKMLQELKKSAEKLSGTIDTTNDSFSFVSINHFGETTEKGENMDKPLKDWTLGELSEYCKKVVAPEENCINCKAQKYIGLCPFEETAPCDWNFDVKPRWTEQDKEDAMMINRVFNGVQIGIARDTLAQLRTSAKDGYPSEYINSDMFPSLKPGESVTLDEIIGADHANNI